MYLSDKLNMNFYWCLHYLQLYIVVFLVKTATCMLNFAPKYEVLVGLSTLLSGHHISAAHGSVVMTMLPMKVYIGLFLE